MESLLLALRNARTDSEKLAALLLVGRLVRSQEVGEEGRRRIFDAVGFTFINRLLATSTLPDGCTENPYHQIALTMLACFSTDADLVLHAQITSKIPLFLGCLSADSSSSSRTEDALQCVQAMSASESGRQKLINTGAIEALTTYYCSAKTQAPAVVKDLLLCLLQHCTTEEPSGHALTSCVDTLAQEFSSNQNAFKFDLCSMLSSVLSLLPCEAEASLSPPPLMPWLSYLVTGLQDLLTSRLTPPQREAALSLAATLCQLCGVQWSLLGTAHKPGSFFKLMISLTAMELVLCLEECESAPASAITIASKSPLLCVCFSLLEHAVVYSAKLSASPQDGCPLKTADLLLLHSTLSEAFSSVIHFLQTVSVLPDPLPQPVLAAAVRVVGVWLAEESLALSAQVCQVLPFLLRVCEFNGGFASARVERSTETDQGNASCSSGETRKKTDLLKFLLPGFCHMTAEEGARNALLAAGAPQTLLHYLKSLAELTPSASELAGRRCLCCQVLLNVCVCDGDHVKGDGSFTQLALYFARLLRQEGVQRDLVLGLNAALLYLMVARRQGSLLMSSEDTSEQALTWRAVYRLLVASTQACLNEASAVQWSEISELWLLTMQEFTAAVEAHATVRSYARECVEGFTQTLKLLTPLEGVEGSQAAVTAICSLLKAITLT